MPRCCNHGPLRLLGAALVLSLGTAAAAKTPVAYTVQVETAAGPRTVQMRGHYDDGVLRGTVTLRHLTLAVEGAPVGDELRGTLRLPDGRALGTFGARPAPGGTTMAVVYRYGDRRGTLQVPVSDVQLDTFRRALAE